MVMGVSPARHPSTRCRDVAVRGLAGARGRGRLVLCCPGFPPRAGRARGRATIRALDYGGGRPRNFRAWGTALMKTFLIAGAIGAAVALPTIAAAQATTTTGNAWVCRAAGANDTSNATMGTTKLACRPV